MSSKEFYFNVIEELLEYIEGSGRYLDFKDNLTEKSFVPKEFLEKFPQFISYDASDEIISKSLDMINSNLWQEIIDYRSEFGELNDLIEKFHNYIDLNYIKEIYYDEISDEIKKKYDF
jgi:hypothetical protein